MNRLPTGILINIFGLLHQIDRSECVRVCRAWDSIISSYCLYRTISINARSQMKKLISIVKLNPQHCKHVERVIIFLNTSMNDDVKELLSYLPALREFCVPSAKLDRWDIRRGAYKMMANYLESITEHRGSVMMTSLLKYNTYHRLKSLTIYDHSDELSVQELFSNLKNTPILEELRIGQCNISIIDMEILRTTAPLLQSVYFSEVYIVANNFRENITNIDVIDYTPITFMKSFSLLFHRENIEVTDVVNFLSYIKKIYTNLTKLELNYLDGIDENEKERVYQDALKPLCLSLGSHLEELSTFVMNRPQDLYGLLKSVGCEIQNLDLEVSSSNWEFEENDFNNQQKYITKLSLKNLRCSTFNWLSDYIVLKELNISFSISQDPEVRFDTIELNSLIKSIPKTVTAITLSRVQLQYDDNTTTSLTSVKELELREIPMYNGLDTKISKIFPQLRTLRLIKCDMVNKEFVFPDLRLRYLYLDDRRPKRKDKNGFLLLKTTDNNEELFYKQMKFRMCENELSHRVTKTDSTIYPKNKTMRYDPIAKDFFITITCQFVERVIY